MSRVLSETEHARLRVAGAADAGALAALLAELDGDGVPLGPEAVRSLLAGMATHPNFRTYLWCDGEQPIGTFSLMIFTGLSHRGAKQALLEAVVITRARRGQGCGEAMIRQALQLAAAAGCYKLSLSSNLTRTAAHRFYERLGFRQHGISFSLELLAGVPPDEFHAP